MKTKEKLIEEKQALEREFEFLQRKIDRLPYSKLDRLRGLCRQQQEVLNKIKSLDCLIKTNE
jgi:prefoldin subunit 5